MGKSHKSSLGVSCRAVKHEARLFRHKADPDFEKSSSACVCPDSRVGQKHQTSISYDVLLLLSLVVHPKAPSWVLFDCPFMSTDISMLACTHTSSLIHHLWSPLVPYNEP